MELRDGTQKEAARPEHYGRVGRGYWCANPTGPRVWRSKRGKPDQPGGNVYCQLTYASERERESRVTLPLPYQADRLTRGSPIRCTHFGPERVVLYPKHFFCGKCKVWENDRAGFRADAKRDSSRFKCDANHTDVRFPTQLKKIWNPSKSLGSYRLYANVSAADVSQLAVEEDLEIVLDVEDEVSCDMEDLSDVEEDEEPASKSRAASNATASLPFPLPPADTTPSATGIRKEVPGKMGAPGKMGEVSATEAAELSVNLMALLEHEKNLNATLRSHVGILEHEAQHMTTKYERLKLRNEMLAKEVKAIKRTTGRGFIQIAERGTSLEDHLRHCLDVAMSTHHQGRRSQKFGTALANVAMTYREGIAYNAVFDHVKEFLRREVFSPYRVARLMDMHGGTLNLLCISLMRSLETKEKNGEAVQFDYVKMVRLIFQSFELDEAALERSIAVSVSIDGATLTRFLSHVMAGMKIKDRAAVCLIAKKPLHSVRNGWSKLQSRHTCFPLHIHMGSETKTKYSEFQSLFDWWKLYSTQGAKADNRPAIGMPGGWNPFNVTFNADMSAIWKSLKRGGGARTNLRPCHCCAVHRDEQHKPNEGKCDRCVANQDEDGEDWQCYHRRIVTDHVLNNMQDELAALQDAMIYQMEQLKDSKLTIEDPNPGVGAGLDRKNDINSIHYDLNQRTTRQQARCSNLLDHELQLRGIPNPVGNMTQRQDTLREILLVEWPVRNLSMDVKACERPEAALFLLMQAVPCVLHMENRVGLKMLTMLLINGVSEVQKGSILGHINSEVDRVDHYITAVQDIMNRTILGSPASPCAWRFPYDKKEKKVGKITLENWRCRRVIQQLDLLIEMSVPVPGRRTRWLRLVDNYLGFMEQACEEKDWNTTQKLESFQRLVDKWYNDWMWLHGVEGVTNYIHMLGAGHIQEYVFEWGNLYEHSQQGWEAFNALIKSFFFRRTPHGGGVKRSRLKPIARWLQRRAIWLCGYDEPAIQEFLRRLDSEEAAARAASDTQVQLEALGELEEEEDDDNL